MSKKTKSGKKKGVVPPALKPWFNHLQKVWTEGKKKNPNYKYKDAMKNAKKTFKKK